LICDVLICDECQDLTAAQADTFLKQPNYRAAHLAEVPSSRTACRVAVRMHLVERSRSHFPSGLRQGVVQNFEKAAALYQLAHQIAFARHFRCALGLFPCRDASRRITSPRSLAAADAKRLAALDLAGAERARANVEAVREVGAELFC